MTILVAWTRRIKDAEELVFASDSRLSGDGRTMDYCPKLQILPRSDCAIGFAGDTGNAYPLMAQMVHAINAHPPLKIRSMDIRALITHVLKIFDSMAHAVECEIIGLSETERAEAMGLTSNFIFGGYSWIWKKFELWNIYYSLKYKKFLAKEAPFLHTHIKAKKTFFGSADFGKRDGNINLGQVAFAGDQGVKAKVKFLQLIESKLDFSHHRFQVIPHLDMEPFEVVREMLRDPEKSSTIGGAPQVIKVYQHMNSAPLAVYWPDKAGGQKWLLGRPVLGYENIDHWILDPDALISSHMQYSKKMLKPFLISKRIRSRVTRLRQTAALL